MRAFTTFMLLCIFSLPILARTLRYGGGDDDDDDDDNDKDEVCSITRPPRKEALGRPYTFSDVRDWDDYPTGQPSNNFYWWTTAKDLRAKKGNPERADEHGIVYLRDKSRVTKYQMKEINKEKFPWTADHILELQIIAEALNRNAEAMDESYLENIKYTANSGNNLVNLDKALNEEKGFWVEQGGGGRISKPLHDYLQKTKMAGADAAYDIDTYVLKIKGFDVRDGYGPVEREWRSYLRSVGIRYTRCT